MEDPQDIAHQESREQKNEETASPDQSHQGLLYALGAVESELAQAEGMRTSIRETAGVMGQDVQGRINVLETQVPGQEEHRRALLDRRTCQLVGHDDGTMEDTWDED